MNNKSLTINLQNIGPIKTAEIELGKVTVLYGPNAAGKTTVARAIEYLIKLMNNIGVECSKLMELINYSTRVGRMVLNDYEVSLERSEGFEKVNVIIKRGAETLHSGGCGVGMYVTGLHIASDLGVDSLAWVRYNDVRLINVGLPESENPPTLTDLLKPSVIMGYISRSASYTKIASDYSRYLMDINDALELVINGRLELQEDKVFFYDGDYYYELDRVAEGIKRAALIITVKALAERLRELGRRPIMFVENFESALHVDYVKSLLDVLSEGNVPVIIETHSGLVIKYGVRKMEEGERWRVYILEDGSAFTDLTKSELFKRERELIG
jgi:energy-coupling factor transporter ATP-binding protein EcfA2